MIEIQRPLEHFVPFGRAGAFEASAGLSIFDGPPLVLSPTQMHVPNVALGNNGISKPSLKRKRSSQDESGALKKDSRGGRPSSHKRRHSEDEDSGDQKRTKLGYHRTSIACGHCRRRKIRCLIQDDEKSNRCVNCIRLKRECSFHPVDQSLPTSKSKHKAAKASQKVPRALSPTNTVPPPKRGHSDSSSIPYPSLPASTAQDFAAFQAPHTTPSHEHSTSTQGKDSSACRRHVLGGHDVIHNNDQVEPFPAFYPPSYEQTWLSPNFQPMTSLGEAGPPVQYEFSASALNTMWDPTTSPATHPLHRSLSWNDLNQHESPEPTFSPPTQSVSWTRPTQRSASFPVITYEKNFIPQSSPLVPQSAMGPIYEGNPVLMSEPLSQSLLQADKAEAINLQLQATRAEASLPLPTISISQSNSPYPDQHAWSIYPGQEAHADPSSHLEDRPFHESWF